MAHGLLYKYSPKIRFLEHGLLRFTQPSSLNDPYEAILEIVFGQYAPEDYEVARRDIQPFSSSPLPDETVEMLMGPMPAHRMDEKAFPGLWPATERRLREEPFDTIAEMDQCLAERAVALSRELADATIGIFSLTASVGEAMWALYGGGDHRGTRTAFNADHSFFSEAKQVIYTERPFHASMHHGLLRIAGVRIPRENVLSGEIDKFPRDLFFRKQKDWSFEQEFRLLRSLNDADSTADVDELGLPIKLFKIPSDAVHSITFDLKHSRFNY